MEQNKDNARWALGIHLPHPPGQEALKFLDLWSFFFFSPSVLFRGGGKSSAVLWKVSKAECFGLACLEFFFSWNLLCMTFEDILPNGSFVSLWKHYLITMSINAYLLSSPKLEWIISSTLTTVQNFRRELWIIWHCFSPFGSCNRRTVLGKMKKMHSFEDSVSCLCLLLWACIYNARGLDFLPGPLPKVIVRYAFRTAKGSGWEPSGEKG